MGRRFIIPGLWLFDACTHGWGEEEFVLWWRNKRNISSLCFHGWVSLWSLKCRGGGGEKQTFHWFSCHRESDAKKRGQRIFWIHASRNTVARFPHISLGTNFNWLCIAEGKELFFIEKMWQPGSYLGVSVLLHFSQSLLICSGFNRGNLIQPAYSASPCRHIGEKSSKRKWVDRYVDLAQFRFPEVIRKRSKNERIGTYQT